MKATVYRSISTVRFLSQCAISLAHLYASDLMILKVLEKRAWVHSEFMKRAI